MSLTEQVRTYFWHRPPRCLPRWTLPICPCWTAPDLMYADWYDGEPILRFMNEANRLDVPVFLNLEHGHKDSQLLKKYAPCQYLPGGNGCCSAGQHQRHAGYGTQILMSGIQTALVTMAKAGCLVAQDHHAGECVRCA